MFVLIVFCVLFGLVIIYLVYRLTIGNYRIKYDNFTIFQGMLGSGKTSILSHLTMKELRRRRFYNFIRWPLFIILFLVPLFNIIHIWVVIIKKKNYFYKYSTCVYSNFPIDISHRFLGLRIGSKKYSICIDKDFFTYNYKVMESSIIVFDELQYILPSVINKKAVFSDDKLRTCLTYLRHCTDCCFFGATQSFGEINVTFRRKVNYIYELSGCRVRKFLRFLPSKVQIRKLTYSEDVSSGNISVLEDTKNLKTVYYFYFPYNRFLSRYGKNLYNLSQSELSYVSESYNNLLTLSNFEVGKPFTRLEFL